MDDDVTRIPLRNRRGAVVAHTLVDTADVALVESGGPWRLSTRGYVARTRGKEVVYLARFLHGLNRGDAGEVDHINGDPLDNRRSNLRVVSHEQNMQNVRPRIRSTSRYRGVHWEASTQSWRAVCQISGVRFSVGRFKNEIEAAHAAHQFRLANMPGAVD